MHQLSRERPLNSQKKKRSTEKNTQIYEPQKRRNGKKVIPSCDYQIRRQSNDQKRKRVCEKTTKVEYLEKEKKGT